MHRRVILVAVAVGILAILYSLTAEGAAPSAMSAAAFAAVQTDLR